MKNIETHLQFPLVVWCMGIASHTHLHKQLHTIALPANRFAISLLVAVAVAVSSVPVDLLMALLARFYIIICFLEIRSLQSLDPHC